MLRVALKATLPLEVAGNFFVFESEIYWRMSSCNIYVRESDVIKSNHSLIICALSIDYFAWALSFNQLHFEFAWARNIFSLLIDYLGFKIQRKALQFEGKIVTSSIFLRVNLVLERFKERALRSFHPERKVLKIVYDDEAVAIWSALRTFYLWSLLRVDL